MNFFEQLQAIVSHRYEIFISKPRKFGKFDVHSKKKNNS